MRLIWPKKKEDWDPQRLPTIPSDLVPSRNSGWLLIAAAQQGYDLYVAMAKEDRSEVSIEKTSSLMGKKYLNFESLVRIDDDREFSMAHSYFIKEGFLDGRKEND